MHNPGLTRRSFLHRSVALAAGAPIALGAAHQQLWAAESSSAAGTGVGAAPNAKVAIVKCSGYGPELGPAFNRCFDLLGGLGRLVKDKTVTVKLNLTGTNFAPFLERPVGETYMTHPATVRALGVALFAAGAKRVRFVESTQSKSSLAGTLALADWDVKALESLGRVEFENTRNLGNGKSYSTLKVPGGGYMFSSFEFNHSYDETDVLISMAKLKNHITAGVTLSLKNLFGITPNSLYGAEAGSEDATEGRGPLHNPQGFDRIKLPGLKAGTFSTEPTWRVPHIVADVCAARPIHLAIIDGITSMKGGEGPWCGGEEKLKFVSPGVLIAGLNPVSTDAVCTAVMGYENPRAGKGEHPFHFCENHIALAEKAGLGTAEIPRIEVLGETITKVRYPYG